MINQIISVNISDMGSRSSTGNPEWQLGYNWDNDRYFINEKNGNELLDVISTIQNQNKIMPNKGSIIYASRASEIPRFKLKEFIRDNKLKKTSKVSFANIIIINKGYFTQLVDCLKFSERRFIKEGMMEKILNYKYNERHNTGSLKTLFKSSSDKNLVGVIDSRRDKNLPNLLKKYSHLQAEYDTTTYPIKGMFLDLYREYRLFELLNVLLNNSALIKSGKMKIVFDEDFFVEMNKEGIELDDDYLQTLRDMLFSEDKSNVKLGFEMMSNLVIDQPTLLSMSFLLNELFHTANFRPSYYVSSNSNLKSLLKVFKTKGIKWESDWKTFGSGLRLNFKEGKEGIIVKKFLLDNINREFKLTNSAAESLVDIVFSTETK